MLELANYINELKTYKIRYKDLNAMLEAEREKADQVIADKNETIKAQDEQIDLLEEQVKTAGTSIFDKANLMAGGAGIATVIIALALLQ